MQYRTLGRTGLRVSVSRLGTMVHAGHFGPMKDSESLGAIDAALELGVNFIDTSDAYGAGYSETLLGNALKGRRDKVILAHQGRKCHGWTRSAARETLPLPASAACLKESLKRLQTDCIDLYQLHNPTVDVIERGEVWEVLEEPRKKARFVTTVFPSTPSTKVSPRSKMGGPIRSSWSIISWPKSRRKRFYLLHRRPTSASSPAYRCAGECSPGR